MRLLIALMLIVTSLDGSYIASADMPKTAPTWHGRCFYNAEDELNDNLTKVGCDRFYMFDDARGVTIGFYTAPHPEFAVVFRGKRELQDLVVQSVAIGHRKSELGRGNCKITVVENSVGRISCLVRMDGGLVFVNFSPR